MQNNRKPHILLVEDDINLNYLLQENLRTKEFDVTVAKAGLPALELIQKNNFDLCILDVMLPEMDGFTLAGKLKERQPNVPFIFLTARNMEKDKLHGFEIGADDYVTKPFSFKELYYRIKVSLRRTNKLLPVPSDETLSLGNIILQPLQRILTINGIPRKLSNREASLLDILLRNTGQYVTRSEILKQVWGNDDYFTAKSMDVYVTRIRKLLKEDPSLEIENLYGTGYRIRQNSMA